MKTSSNKFHFLKFLPVILIALAIPLAVYLSSQPQEIRQLAAPGPTLPFDASLCTTVAGGSYNTSLTTPDTNNPASLAVQPAHPDRPSGAALNSRASQHADYNLWVRGWTGQTTAGNYLVSYGSNLTDSNGKIRPRLYTILEHATQITSTWRVNDWNWPTDLSQVGTAGSPISTYPVTLIGLATTSGSDNIRMPFSQYDIQGGYGGIVIYAAPDSVTLKYTREDNVVKGYTIHILNFSVDAGLLSAYRTANNNGRNNLPAVKPCQIIGKASGSEINVAIRDIGSFLDPRSAEDWWGVVKPTTPPVTATPTTNPLATVTPTTAPSVTPGGPTLTIVPTVIPTVAPTIAAAVPNLPNCWNIIGPTTIILGHSASFSAQFTSPQGDMYGLINAININSLSAQPPPTNRSSWDWNPWPPSTIPNANSGTLAFGWTPTQAGTYQVFCSAWNQTAGLECRGEQLTIDGPPRYICPGPKTEITVNVSSAAIPTPIIGQTSPDMCQMTALIGGGVLTPLMPVTIAAIAKPNYNISSYIFGFYNRDNNDSPISFTQGQDYTVSTESNNIQLKYDDLNKNDLNNAGAKPQSIKILAYFQDDTGATSTESAYCTQYITISNPTPTTQLTNSPTPDMSSGPINTGVIVIVMGVLIIVIIVSLNFFFKA
jgi:hypothetical protein